MHSFRCNESFYGSHRTTDEGYNTFENFNPYLLKVQNVQKTTTLAQYQSWIDQAKKDKSWLYYFTTVLLQLQILVTGYC